MREAVLFLTDVLTSLISRPNSFACSRFLRSKTGDDETIWININNRFDMGNATDLQMIHDTLPSIPNDKIVIFHSKSLKQETGRHLRFPSLVLAITIRGVSLKIWGMDQDLLHRETVRLHHISGK